jgi:hypothetical protein
MNGEPSGYRSYNAQSRINANEFIDSSLVNINKLTSMLTTFDDDTIKCESQTDESQQSVNLFSSQEPSTSLISNCSVTEDTDTDSLQMNYNTGNREMVPRRGDVSPTSTDVILSQGSSLRSLLDNNVNHSEIDRDGLNEEFKPTPPSENSTPVGTNSSNYKYVMLPLKDNAKVSLDQLYQEIKSLEKKLQDNESKSIAELTHYRYTPGGPKMNNPEHFAFDGLASIEIKEYKLYQ